jgi:hypothetical protein
MPRCRSTIFPVLSAVALVAIIAASPIAAQPAGPAWGPGVMMGPGMMNWRIMGRAICDPHAAGLAEWRVETIERAIQPTEAQRLALTELRAASAKAAEIVSMACPRELPQSSPARLEVMEKRLDAMLQAVKTVRPAFDALYASLSVEQKARLDSAGPRNWGWRQWLWPWNRS